MDQSKIDQVTKLLSDDDDQLLEVLDAAEDADDPDAYLDSWLSMSESHPSACDANGQGRFDVVPVAYDRLVTAQDGTSQVVSVDRGWCVRWHRANGRFRYQGAAGSWSIRIEQIPYGGEFPTEGDARAAAEQHAVMAVRREASRSLRMVSLEVPAAQPDPDVKPIKLQRNLTANQMIALDAVFRGCRIGDLKVDGKHVSTYPDAIAYLLEQISSRLT